MAVVIGPQGGTVRVPTERWHANVRERRQQAQAGQQAQAVDAAAEGWSVGVTSSVSVGGEPYEGEYEASARFSDQTFPTMRKTMAQDFKVRAINYTEAPNDSGTTVVIGG